MILFGKKSNNKINFFENQMLKLLPASEVQEVKHATKSCYKYLLETDELHA